MTSQPSPEKQGSPGPRRWSPLQRRAEKIWTFVDAHCANIEAIVVHCDAGASRSAAVAAALAKVLSGDDRDFSRGRYEPNARVYEMLLAA